MASVILPPKKKTGKIIRRLNLTKPNLWLWNEINDENGCEVLRKLRVKVFV